MILALVISACSATAPEEEAIDLDTVNEPSAATDAMRAAGASTMADVVDALGVDVLGPGEVTLFAPSDRAFLTLDADVLASLLADNEQLAAVVEDHTLDGSVSVENLMTASPLLFGSGTFVDVHEDDASIRIGDAVLAAGDLTTDGTTIHVIDGFLVDMTDQRGEE